MVHHKFLLVYTNFYVNIFAGIQQQDDSFSRSTIGHLGACCFFFVKIGGQHIIICATRRMFKGGKRALLSCAPPPSPPLYPPPLPTQAFSKKDCHWRICGIILYSWYKKAHFNFWTLKMLLPLCLRVG